MIQASSVSFIHTRTASVLQISDKIQSFKFLKFMYLFHFTVKIDKIMT